MARKESKKIRPKKASRRSLDPLREQLSVLAREANKRVKKLSDRGLASRALYEAQRTFKRMTSRDESEGLFKSDLKTRKQIMREFARVHEFLNDYTSTVQGARRDRDIKLDRLKGAFGGQYKEMYGVNYDKSRINDDVAKAAFDLYRRVIERAGGWERAVGVFQGKESLVGYGSEVLITNIYDMVEQGMSDASILDLAESMVNNAIKSYEKMAEQMVSDYDYGIVVDDEDAKERRRRTTYMYNLRKGLL